MHTHLTHALTLVHSRAQLVVKEERAKKPEPAKPKVTAAKKKKKVWPHYVYRMHAHILSSCSPFLLAEHCRHER